MAAWINLTLATMERGLEAPKSDSKVIQLFTFAEKISGVPRVQVYTVTISLISSFLLLGIAAEWISTLMGLVYPVVYLLINFLTPNSFLRLPKYSHLFFLYTLSKFFIILPHHPIMMLPPASRLLTVFWTQFQKILQFRCFLSLVYRPVRSSSYNYHNNNLTAQAEKVSS